MGLFGELLLFVFDICNMLDRSQQAFLRLDEELCNAENVCSIITFNCQWDRCPSAVNFSLVLCLFIVHFSFAESIE